MIRVLVRHHPLLRPIYIKWMLVAVATGTAWLGLMAMRLHGDIFAFPWVPFTTIWLVPALFLALGPHGQRAREFALALPLPARIIWRAHAAAVMLTSGAMMLVMLAFVTASVLGLRSLYGPLLVPDVDPTLPLLNLWGHGLAWWLLLAALMLIERPGVADLRRDRRWMLRQGGLLVVVYLGLLGLGSLGLATVVVPLAAAITLLVVTQRRLPATMSIAPREPAAARGPVAPVPLAEPPSRWRRRPGWLTVLQATAKHPTLQLAAATVMLVLLGITFSNWTVFSDTGEHLGVFMIPMIAYCLFALAATPLLKLAIVDHLALSRSRLLGYLLWPQVGLLAAGLLTGEVLLQLREVPRHDLVSWSNEADSYGIRIVPRYFAVSWTDPPVNVGPDGTQSTPPARWRPLGPRGPVLYKPYHVPTDASVAFAAWQLERAVVDIYGQAVPAAELRDRFLAGSAEGPAAWRDDAPTLREAYPELEPRGFAGLLPLQILLVGLLFQVAYLIYLSRFRPGVSDRGRKVTFVALLAALLGLYLAPFILGILHLGDPAGLNVLVLAVSNWLVSAAPGGTVTLWAATILLLFVGQQLVLRRFRRAEWPPVREDDLLGDVLG